MTVGELSLVLPGDVLALWTSMKLAARQPAVACTTETVWDGGASGTGVCSEGRELLLGRDAGGWSPEQLLLFGAESSLMESILAAAREADVQVLGYVSSAHLDVPDERGAVPRLTLKPCIVVASLDDRQHARLMSAAVARTSLAGRLLGKHLHVGLDVRLEPTA